MTDNDRYVTENYGRLPWFVTASMLEPTCFSSNDQYFWVVPDPRRIVARLRRAGKGHRDGVRYTGFDLFDSTSIRRAIERWA